jgi:hypothetical protein
MQSYPLLHIPHEYGIVLGGRVGHGARRCVEGYASGFLVVSPVQSDAFGLNPRFRARFGCGGSSGRPAFVLCEGKVTRDFIGDGAFERSAILPPPSCQQLPYSIASLLVFLLVILGGRRIVIVTVIVIAPLLHLGKEITRQSNTFRVCRLRPFSAIAIGRYISVLFVVVVVAPFVSRINILIAIAAISLIPFWSL